MANKFTAGMRNFVEVLNQMWDAFAAGPYNALPLNGGTVTGVVNITDRLALLSKGNGVQTPTQLRGPEHDKGEAASLTLSMGVGGTGGRSYPGYFQWYTASGADLGGGNTFGRLSMSMQLRAQSMQDNVESGNLIAVSGGGDVAVAGTVKTPLVQADRFYAGYTGNAPQNVIAMYGAPEGTVLLTMAYCGEFFVAAGAPTNPAATVLTLSMNTVTGRSISTRGTINAGGADYAEYLLKGLLCGTILPGQIVGIDSEGRLTDKWDLAVSFAVKSTNPCMVGGDTWAAHLGERPTAPTSVPAAPEAPTRTLPTGDTPGDTDDKWEEKQAQYATLLAEHHALEQAYATADAEYQAQLASYEAALEAARQTVDRIAFAGQVPVNLQGATPGQYIVPVQDGEAIAGLAVYEDDLTMKQYLRSVGKVIAIEGDGRARIIVKVA